jgi:FkbM family methyltransferase
MGNGLVKDLARFCATKIFRFVRATTGYVPPEKVFKHLHFVGPYKVKLPNQHELEMYSWGHRVENELAWLGWDGHEPEERRCWAAMVEGGGDIFDIGANTATFAITAKGLSPRSRVFAFEPVKRIANLARENIVTSGLDINVVCAALARQNGELPIYDPGGANAYSASLDADFLPGQKDSYMVPVYSLDEFCAENNTDPVAIKLDVEGFEGEVIRGSVELLKKGRCVLLCEWLGKSESHLEALKILRDSGYVALDVHDLSEVDLSESRGYGERNVILAHKDRLHELNKSLT